MTACLYCRARRPSIAWKFVCMSEACITKAVHCLCGFTLWDVRTAFLVSPGAGQFPRPPTSDWCDHLLLGSCTGQGGRELCCLGCRLSLFRPTLPNICRILSSFLSPVLVLGMFSLFDGLTIVFVGLLKEEAREGRPPHLLSLPGYGCPSPRASGASVPLPTRARGE